MIVYCGELNSRVRLIFIKLCALHGYEYLNCGTGWKCDYFFSVLCRV